MSSFTSLESLLKMCSDAPPPALPQWLSNFDRVTEEPLPKTLDPVRTYQRRLINTRDPNELEALWSEVGIEPQHKVLFSQMANTHFLDNLHTPGMGFRTLFSFFRNPKLNVPEARNIMTFVNQVKEKGIPQVRLGELINRIRDSLRLGTMTVPELRAVMDSIPGLCAKTCQGDLEAVNNWQFGAYWAIWRGMTSCKILPIEKFDKAIIRKMAESLLSLKDPPGISDAGKLGKISASSHTDPALFRLEVYRQLWPASSYVEPHDFVSHFVSWIQSLDEVYTEGPDRTPGQLRPDVLKSLLDSLDAGRAQEIMADTTSALLTVGDNITMDDRHRRLLRFWFVTISQTRHRFRDIFISESSPVHRIDPIVAIPYLKTFHVDTICRLWMRCWLPQYVAEDGGTKQWKARQKGVRRFFEERRRLPSKDEPRQITPFFDAICALEAKGLPYETAISKAVELIFAMYGPLIAHKLHKKAVKESLTINDPRPFAAAIEAIASTSPMQALKYFKSSPEVWLSLCPRLPLALIQHDSLPRDELFALLDRRGPAIQSHRADKESTSNNQLSALDTELINIIAYAYANQTSRPTRHRFRNVYFCYLYMRDRGVPLSPLLSKAVVRAAITAPLENYEWVSTVKLRWVLRLVLSIEGPEVAERLDKLVWRWRGEVIREARRRWDEAGLFRTMGPSTVVTVRRAGLFDHDFPKWRRPFKKVVMPAGFFAPRFLRRTRFAVGEKEMRKRSWGRLSRREGGMGGVTNLGGECKGHHVSLY